VVASVRLSSHYAHASPKLSEALPAPIYLAVLKGVARSGKSFMSNELLEYLGLERRFQESPSTEPCTVGADYALIPLNGSHTTKKGGLIGTLLVLDVAGLEIGDQRVGQQLLYLSSYNQAVLLVLTLDPINNHLMSQLGEMATSVLYGANPRQPAQPAIQIGAHIW